MNAEHVHGLHIGALQGMPPEARILIQLPDGQLVDIDYVAAAFVGDDNQPGGAASNRHFGLLLVAADPGGQKLDVVTPAVCSALEH